eukprot:s47_g65.t1
MEIARGLAETNEYLESLETSGVSECAFGKVKAQQLTAWTSRIKAEKFGAEDARTVIQAVQKGKWSQEEKDKLLEVISFQPAPAATSGNSKNRPHQELQDFGSFLRRSDVEILQGKNMSWVTKMDHIAQAGVKDCAHDRSRSSSTEEWHMVVQGGQDPG